MSKALRIAQESIEKNGKLDLKTEGLSPQEEYLLMTATLALRKTPQERRAEWKNCEEIAKRLDAGGIIDLPFIERLKHRQAASYQRQQALERERGRGRVCCKDLERMISLPLISAVRVSPISGNVS